MKTQNAIAIYIIAVLVSMYAQTEYFFRVAGGKHLLPIPLSDWAFFILGSGVLTLIAIVYIIIRKMLQGYETVGLRAQPLLIAVLAVNFLTNIIVGLVLNKSALVNDHFFTSIDFVVMFGGPTLLLLLAIFVRKRLMYLVFMTLAVVYLLLLLNNVWSSSHYSWFEFLGGGTLHDIAQILAVYFFAFFARKELLLELQPTN